MLSLLSSPCFLRIAVFQYFISSTLLFFHISLHYTYRSCAHRAEPLSSRVPVIPLSSYRQALPHPDPAVDADVRAILASAPEAQVTISCERMLGLCVDMLIYRCKK